VKVVRTSLVYMAGIVLGITVGLWTASMQRNCPGLCLFGPPRFAAIECVLMGALISIAVLMAALAVDQDFPSETDQTYRTIMRYHRTITRFLFEDLSRQREH
jgi:hypothetical protein